MSPIQDPKKSAEFELAWVGSLAIIECNKSRLLTGTGNMVQAQHIQLLAKYEKFCQHLELVDLVYYLKFLD